MIEEGQTAYLIKYATTKGIIVAEAKKFAHSADFVRLEGMKDIFYVGEEVVFNREEAIEIAKEKARKARERAEKSVEKMKRLEASPKWYRPKF